MNPGVLQQMNMAAAGENPNLYTMRPPPPTPQTLPYNFSPPNPFPSSLILPINPSWLVHHQQLPQSWSQPLLEGLVAEEDKASLNQFFQANNKKLEVWEENQDQDLDLLHKVSSVYVKQEIYGHANHPEFQAITKSPKSCVTTNNMLDFSSKKFDRRHPPPDRSSTECNSTSAITGGAAKKARVEPSSSQFPFKVRKEKLGDRITTLHQMVSPFGKTDTASVLLEAIGYIRFLQSQIEALSLPYLGSATGNNNNNIMRHLQQQNSVQGERSCIFPKEPGQDSINEEAKKDLRSRGLCLVPVSCTLQVGSDNGTDYWAPAFGGGFQ